MTAPVGGLSQKAWGLAETTFDTGVAFAAGNGFDFQELSIEPSLDFSKRVSHVGTGSLQGQIEEKRGGQWSGTFYVAPNAVGVAPDVGFMLEHAMGLETVVGGTSVTYSLVDTATPSSLQITRYASDELLEHINGAWIEELEIEIAGGEEPKVTVSGGFASYGFLGQGLLTLAATVEPIAETEIALESGDARRVRPGVYVKIAADDGTANAGYLVTAVDYTTDVMTISPGLVVATSGGELITPNIPVLTVSGSIVGGINGNLSLGAVSMNMIKSVTKLTTGIIGLDKEATSNRVTRLIRDGRTVEGEIEAYYLDENVPFAGGAWNGNKVVMILRAGPNTAAKRMLITHLAAQLMVVEGIEIPDNDAASWLIPYNAEQSAAAKDEMTILFS